MAGTLDLIQRAYTGAQVRDGMLYFAPILTDRLDGLSFPMQVRGTPIRVTVGDAELTVVITGGFSRPISVGIGDDVRELGPGERCTFKLAGADAPRSRRPSRGGPVTTPAGFRGAIFDVDGVLVDSPHEAAWRDTFTELMEHEWADDPRPDDLDARRVHARRSTSRSSPGKPRMDGARPRSSTSASPIPTARAEALRRAQAGAWSSS